MNQTHESQRDFDPGKSENGRVAMRDLVTIGQRWQRKARRPLERYSIVIVQVHRADRSVDARPITVDGPVTSGPLRRVSFAELRKSYRLLDPEGQR